MPHKQLSKLGLPLRENVPLIRFNTMKIGGNAQFLVESGDSEKLAHLLEVCHEHSIPYLVVGGGSNLVFDDQGFDGVIIRLPLGTYSLQASNHYVIATFPAGYPTHLAAQKMIDEGLGGCESFYGLPGTIGGAVVMNSKWPKDSFSTGDVFVSGDYIFPQGSRKMVKKSEMDFSYGRSSLQSERGILLSARFLLEPIDKKIIKSKCESVMKYRHETQPVGVFTAGCIFKNISTGEQDDKNLPTRSAGYLIDKSGCKGMRVGGISVSTIHANFFVNNNKATSAQFDELVAKVSEKVQASFGIMLHMEVMRVFPSGEIRYN